VARPRGWPKKRVSGRLDEVAMDSAIRVSCLVEDSRGARISHVFQGDGRLADGSNTAVS
jgi:hypothetical protein